LNFTSIPRDRVGVLIGIDGRTKRRIEKITDTKIDVSKDGEVHVEGKDSLKVMKSLDLIKAIGRGFNADKAFYLIDDSIYLETIQLEGSKNNIKRLKARLIGEKGKARNMIDVDDIGLIEQRLMLLLLQLQSSLFFKVTVT